MRILLACLMIFFVATEVGAKGREHRGQRVCAADIERFCSDVKSGQSMQPCLIRHASQLSEACTAVLSKKSCKYKASTKLKATFACNK
jgi:Cysteine rich repeat